MEIEGLSPIQRFYYGKCIFITGVTGFLGKMLLEKLLRYCPGIGDIYLLMREKKGKTAEQRLEDILNCDLFKMLRNELPELRKKIKVIYGDLEKPELGVEPEDIITLKENVNIVFHSAARVRWDDPLRVSITCHILATKSLLDLLKQFKHLESFLYVSTSYVHRDPDFTVPEHVAKKTMTPKQISDILEWMDDEVLEATGSVLLKGATNSYLFTKALAENVVEDEHGEIPTAIVRPCNISPSYKDPFPGWGDTVQGIQGLMLAAAKGFLRTLYAYKGMKINIIPADVVVNACIVSAWYSSTFRQNDVLVLNCVIDYDKLPEADSGLLQVVLSKRDKYPLVNMYRYPDFTMYYSPFLYHIHAFFDHLIPAVVGDTLLFIFTGKTLMLRLYKKINFLFGVFIKIGLEPWICKMKNYHMIQDRLTKEDAEMFFLDTSDLEWEKYIDDILLAGRKQLAKEDPSNIPYAKKKAKVWWFVTTLLKWTIIFYIIYLIYSKLCSYDFTYTSIEFGRFDQKS